MHRASTRLVRENDVIVIEDLAVANMVRNRHLARAISWVETASVPLGGVRGKDIITCATSSARRRRAGGKSSTALPSAA